VSRSLIASLLLTTRRKSTGCGSERYPKRSEMKAPHRSCLQFLMADSLLLQTNTVIN
jgi:hypothetical protein